MADFVLNLMKQNECRTFFSSAGCNSGPVCTGHTTEILASPMSRNGQEYGLMRLRTASGLFFQAGKYGNYAEFNIIRIEWTGKK